MRDYYSNPGGLQSRWPDQGESNRSDIKPWNFGYIVRLDPTRFADWVDGEVVGDHNKKTFSNMEGKKMPIYSGFNRVGEEMD